MISRLSKRVGHDLGTAILFQYPTIAKLAPVTAYLAEIRKAQPQGPYLLGGWSSGGTIAFEMAQQLQQQGRTIVRSVYGSHTTNEVAFRLAHHPKIVEPAMQILDGKMYILHPLLIEDERATISLLLPSKSGSTSL